MLLVLAIVGLFVLPDPWRWIAVPVAAVIELGELYVWTRVLRRYRIRTGSEALIGARVEVLARCAPQGRVRLGGEIWNARCAEPLEAGEAARVVSVDGLTLLVAPDR